MGLILDIMKLNRPPRAAFLNFPLGHPFGKPFDRAGQAKILRSVLTVLESAREPITLVQLPIAWGEPFTFKLG